MTERLSGRRVLVTRPRERSEELCFLLEDEGADVIAMPLLELAPPENDRPLLAAAEQLHRYAWVAFASPSGVQAWLEAVRLSGTERHLPQLKLATVGPKTAKALRDHGLQPTLESPVATGEGLLDAMKAFLSPGTEILLPVAENSRPKLYDGLMELGMAVTRVVAYRSQAAAVEPAAFEALKEAPPEAILFASPRTVDAFLETGGALGKTLAEGARRVAIGPTTAQALSACGLAPTAVASEPTAARLVEAVVQALAATP